ncbi:MAG: glutaredoxin family protein [Pseudomonadota bacterium]|nr:glutaredoxin family protein [Pseudomonadota bacterium]
MSGATLILLTRAYCSLCDEMQRQVEAFARERGIRVELIDIDAHASLVEQFDVLVPVLFLGAPDAASELCHYRFDAERVSAAIGGPVAPQIG